MLNSYSKTNPIKAATDIAKTSLIPDNFMTKSIETGIKYSPPIRGWISQSQII
ncbi:hypothetical protein VCRA2122O340_100082 [Vibrio crassostreae]|nr:hypothetical protein VCRA2122O340_100082 [Vibrio crassostreae]CAK3692436.1 hypothetical protein VCRA2128O346_100082 [Vibrio crassostreae]